MIITSIKYHENERTARDWWLQGLRLGQINLLVGKNASGKSRTLNLVANLGFNLANTRPIPNSTFYDVDFDHFGERLRYELATADRRVISEKFYLGDALKLDRGTEGVGKIWAEKVGGGSMMEFQTPEDQLAAVARRDSIQHPYLQRLFEWGDSVRKYDFGTYLGRQHYAVIVEKGGKNVDERDQDEVVPLFRKAQRELGHQRFTKVLLDDMARLGYELDDVNTSPPVSIQFPGAPGELVGLSVKERSLECETDQNSISQGMFRALSLLIHVNYAQLRSRATCVIIDDIGEGLDFDRSCRLVQLLREKAQASRIQLIMATNDRFVMNQVPLEEWSVLDRQANHVRVLNYHNSKELFDEFKYTGLSNFDFFATDYASQTATTQ